MLKETASGWDEDNVNRLAASLAYYTLLSTAPLIILAVAIITRIAFGQDAACEHIGGELASVVGGGADTAVKAIAKNAQSPGSAWRFYCSSPWSSGRRSLGREKYFPATWRRHTALTSRRTAGSLA